MIVAPTTAISDVKEAANLVRFLKEVNLSRDQTYEIDADTTLFLKQMGKGKKSLIFTPALVSREDVAAYVLPETASPILFRKGMPPREYFYDSIVINRETAALVQEIEIGDKNLEAFVAERLREKPQSKAGNYLLVYHNYRDQQGKLKLKGDALVLLYNERRGKLLKETVTHVLVHKFQGTILKRLPLETVLEEHPPHVVTSAGDVKLSRRLYGDIYQKREEGAGVGHFEQIKNIWPFPMPSTGIIELFNPSISIRSQWNLFSSAMEKDHIYKLASLGNIFQSCGKGLVEGALLYEILNLAQNELKVAALLGVLSKMSLGFFLVANNRASAEVERLEAKERLGEALNQQFPLWEMGAHYKTTSELIRRYSKISLAYLFSSFVYLQLFPPIFKNISDGVSPFYASAAFVAGYLGVEFLNVGTDAFENRNSFKIAENRLRNNPKLPEFKKTFWTIHAFLDNLSLMLHQASFVAGLGLYSLFAVFSPAYAAFAGVTLGGVAILFCALRFLLPVFGREEKSRLEINSTEALRFGKALKFSENVSLQLGEDVKVEIIEQNEKKRIIVPDFGERGIKLKVKNLGQVYTKENFLGRILPFSFAKKQQVIVRTRDEKDPLIIFTFYSQEKVSVQEIIDKYIVKGD